MKLIMSKNLNYYKQVLEKVSFDVTLFKKELEIAGKKIIKLLEKLIPEIKQKMSPPNSIKKKNQIKNFGQMKVALLQNY